MSTQDQSNILGDADLVNEAVVALSDGELSFGEIVHLGGVLAGKVNRCKQLSGAEKQKLVVQTLETALSRVLEKKPEIKEKVEAATEFAKNTLPSVLNLAVSAARGKLDLQKSSESLFACLFQLLSCTKGQVPLVPKMVAAPKEPEVTDKAEKKSVSESEQAKESKAAPAEEVPTTA